MRDDDCPEHDESEPTALDTRLRALVPDPVPEDRPPSSPDGDVDRPLAFAY